jgi:hypothetical protein
MISAENIRNQKMPLALYPVHVFLSRCSLNFRLLNAIRHGFKQEEEGTLLYPNYISNA